MTSARVASLDWVCRSLGYELPGEDRDALRDRAESLVAIAEHFHRPMEELVEWIHSSAPEKEWSSAEYRSYCERLSAQ